MKKIQKLLTNLFRIPICACGKVLNLNPGIRQGITMEEARKYLVTPPHGVHEYESSFGDSVFTSWNWRGNVNRGDNAEYIAITFVDGIVKEYYGVTPDIALVAMPHGNPQLLRAV